MRLIQSAIIGWVGGFCGNAVLGALFSLPLVREILYDPHLQSHLFIDITPGRNIAVSVAGLIFLSSIHGVGYLFLEPGLSRRPWFQKGAIFGIIIWAFYWVFQEWFIYITLFHEPLSLAALELAILLFGSLIEGLVIARLFLWKDSGKNSVPAASLFASW